MPLPTSHRIDMLHGPLVTRIIAFALPIAASSLLQQLFNSVDLAVVGHFARQEALATAAVGCNSSVINLIVNLFVGVSVGANVAVSTAIGQKDEKRASSAIHSSMTVAIVSGVFLLALTLVVARPILTLMDTPPEVLPMAVEYLRIYALGMPFIMVYNFASAILRSIGDTRRPLFCLTCAGVLNAGLNLLLVIVFHLDVAGVAIATVVSNVVSSTLVVVFLLRDPQARRETGRSVQDSAHRASRRPAVGGLQPVQRDHTEQPERTGIHSGGRICRRCELRELRLLRRVGLLPGGGDIHQPELRRRAVQALQQDLPLLSGLRHDLLGGPGMAVHMAASVLRIAVHGGCGGGRIRTDEDGDHALAVLHTAHIRDRRLRASRHGLFALTVVGTCLLRIFWVFAVFPIFGTFESLLAVYPVSWSITGTAVLTSYFILRGRAYRRHHPAHQ